MFFAHAVNGRFQPTLPARGATRLAACRVSGSTISTHAPRTGSDTTNCIVEISTTHFNPRSPHGERQTSMPAPSYMSAFQPSLPARGATCCRISHTSTRQPFQPTLPARGATDTTFSGVCPTSFQPTLPARGATGLCADCHQKRAISTHAPRTGSDEGCSSSAGTSRHFNPRSPHGERRHAARLYDGAVRFQSTLPARGATLVVGGASKLVAVFQSTLPARGATPHPSASNATECISIHAPRTGSDDLLATSVESLAIFQSTLPARGATGSKRMSTRKQFLFQSTLPARGATPRFLLFG